MSDVAMHVHIPAVNLHMWGKGTEIAFLTTRGDGFPVTFVRMPVAAALEELERIKAERIKAGVTRA